MSIQTVTKVKADTDNGAGVTDGHKEGDGRFRGVREEVVHTDVLPLKTRMNTLP